VHRVGRTGRAGETGIGITFVGTEQATEVGHIAGELKLHAEFARSGLNPRRASAGPHRAKAKIHRRPPRHRRPRQRA
jgi:superfamily II DNA/RNA helicase